MDSLLPVINKLQDVFNTIGAEEPFDLPQIVVIGSQSSGKSSVLENLVGRDFLPRGEGIVTRRPLILQLIHTTSEPEYGEFLHKDGKKYTSFDDIRQEIVNDTDRITGRNKGVSPDPINLKIYSPHVLNLTLVDLPGITRVPVGDQPSDIEKQIRRMVHNYIEKKNAIILAVSTANVDISNSDALQIAREVDPEGIRTIGVITKLDIMDKGTDAMKILNGSIIPLRLGYIGVINRSQLDINQKKPIRESQKAEEQYFATHPVYRTIANRCGTKYLATTLSKILHVHIRQCIPELKNKVAKMIQETSSILDDDVFASQSKEALLLQLLTKFSDDYKNAIDGKLSDVSHQEISAGARISYVFNESYGQCLDKMNLQEGLTMNDIRTVVRNAAGTRPSLFIPETSFELLVKRQILRLEDPSIQCLEFVYEELARIIHQLENKGLERFPVLRTRIIEAAKDLLQKCRAPARSMINNLIQIELSYVNTNHPDFIGASTATAEIIAEVQKQDQKLNSAQAGKPKPRDDGQAVKQLMTIEKEKWETELLRKLLLSYFDVVRKNIRDTVPKAIMFFLVNHSKENMQNELVTALYKTELIDELLAENPEVAARRTEAQKRLKVLVKANEIAVAQGSADGFRVIINTGRVGQQEVPHVHAHIVGGSEPVGPMLKRI